MAAIHLCAPARTPRRSPTAVLAVTADAPLTRVFAVGLGLGVVVAALVGLSGDRMVPSHSAAVYRGAFVGMASLALLAGSAAVTAAGLAC
ncbi:hypothetical protein GCM10008995_23620 [Halobellus salinus]|uniref:Uncharacterized protein n=1 Tax=Halobellus salinus TaxID=931585 RepID=A0A830EHS9_9EURY|nr:hypothetical protein [Halobellus salinus]GGJ13072.1 hypothetical protein GCM10008995_23620 [Halobellus salinus]SMP32441.1 hypothetical protein SAMN06265347_12035 [Halobellus salinus]